MQAPVPDLQHKPLRQLLIVEAPPQGTPLDAPELQPLLEQGWQVLETSPRITQTGARHLVVLGIGEALVPAPASEF